MQAQQIRLSDCDNSQEKAFTILKINTDKHWSSDLSDSHEAGPIRGNSSA